MGNSHPAASRPRHAGSFATPRVVDESGVLLSLDAFRSWLESQRDIGPLESLVAPILGIQRDTEKRTPGPLAQKIAEACYGAYVFDIVDTRKKLRERDSSLRRHSETPRRWLQELEGRLLDHEEQLMAVTRAVEERLRAQYGRTFAFPEPQEFFVLDVLKALASEIESRPSQTATEALPFLTRHGCLDYGRAIQGLKTRSRRQMLAFNLVYLFRSATLGSPLGDGSIPKGGRPHAEIVAKLVGATFPEGAKDGPVTGPWVHSTVKSILRDNPGVRVVPWPIGRNQVRSHA